MNYRLLASMLSGVMVNHAVLAEEAGSPIPIKWHGLVEVEAASGEDFAGEDFSDIVLATVELGAEAQVNPWTRINLTYLHEEDDTEPGEIDQATITLGREEASPFYLSGGLMYVPFGRFESAMISDPLTLELGETRESALQLGFVSGGLYGAVYAFNGDAREAGDDDAVGQYGIDLGYAWRGPRGGIELGAGYISSLADTDGVSGADLNEDGVTDLPLDSMSNLVGGVSAHVIAETGPWTFIGEYVGATEAFDAPDLPFDGSGAQPTAWNIEAVYTFELTGREAGIALGYQGSDEAVDLGLPASRTLAAISLAVADNSAVSLEYAADEDYDEGTGNSAHTVTLQFAAEF